MWPKLHVGTGEKKSKIAKEKNQIELINIQFFLCSS